MIVLAAGPELMCEQVEQIGDFRLSRKIGRGAERTVYEAQCLRAVNGLNQGDRVALCCFRERDPQALEREVKILQRLDHPGVLRYKHSFIVEDATGGELFCLVTELLQGETLNAHLDRTRGGLPWDEVCVLLKQILEALIYVSRKGVVHRDIKPSNVFLTDRGVVKLIDFGLARQQLEGDTSETTGGVKGSLDYIAPDFVNPPWDDFHGDELSDIFSLGVCLYQVVTGRLPFEPLRGDYQAFLSRWGGAGTSELPFRNEPFRQSVFRAIPKFRDVILRCLDRDRSRRYSTFSAVLNEVSTIEPPKITNGVDRYHLIELLGKGTFGEVFQARHFRGEERQPDVAVKRLLHARYADRFRGEAEMLHSYPHPHLVRYVDFVQRDHVAGEQYYLVLEFLSGMPQASLKERLRAAKDGLSAPEMLRLFLGYLDCLDHLHQAGIIHRDIKPGNLYAPPGEPSQGKIFDLGIALDENGTVTCQQVPGTLNYMAPEFAQTGGDRGSPQSDIYAVGVSLFEALTGTLPLPRLPSGDRDGELRYVERARMNGAAYEKLFAFEHPLLLRESTLVSVLRKALAHDPSRRFHTAGEMRVELEKVLLSCECKARVAPKVVAVEGAIAAGDFVTARRLCAEVFAEMPDHPRALLLNRLATCLETAKHSAQEGNFAAAVAVLHEAQRDFSGAPLLQQFLTTAEQRLSERERETASARNLQAAETAFQNREYAATAKYCDALLVDQPSHARARALRDIVLPVAAAEAASRRGNWSEAERILVSAQTAHPNEERLRILAKEAREGQEQQTVRVGGILTEARAAAVIGDFPAAGKLCDLVLAELPEHESGIRFKRILEPLQNAATAGESGDWAVAERLLAETVGAFPQESWLQPSLAETRRRREEQVARTATFEETIAQAVQSREFSKAGTLCTAFLTEEPKSAVGLAWKCALEAVERAEAAARIRQWELAVSVLKDLQRSHPTAEWLQAKLSQAQAHFQQQSERVRRELPRIEDALVTGDYEVAQRVGQALLNVVPGHERTHVLLKLIQVLKLANQFAADRQWADAIQCLEAASHSYLNEPLVRDRLNRYRLDGARFAHASNSFARAIEWSDAVLKEDPRCDEALSIKATAEALQRADESCRCRDFDRAVEVLRIVRQRDPENVQINEALEDALAEQNEWKQATGRRRRLTGVTAAALVLGLGITSAAVWWPRASGNRTNTSDRLTRPTDSQSWTEPAHSNSFPALQPMTTQPLRDKGDSSASDGHNLVNTAGLVSTNHLRITSTNALPEILLISRQYLRAGGLTVVVPLEITPAGLSPGTLLVEASSDEPQVVSAAPRLDEDAWLLDLKPGQVGDATVTVWATSSNGQTGAARQIEVSVQQRNRPPVIVLTKRQELVELMYPGPERELDVRLTDDATPAQALNVSAECRQGKVQVESEFVDSKWRLKLKPQQIGSGKVVIKATDAEGVTSSAVWFSVRVVSALAQK